MPIEEYYKGRGRKVMEEMKRRYGREKGERVFYATAKTQGQEPAHKRRRERKMLRRQGGAWWAD